MWDELAIERAVSEGELASAVARALGVDRERITVVSSRQDAPADGIVLERRVCDGDFALRVGFHRAPATSPIDHVALYRALAQLLSTRLLVDDGELDPHTAMLVTATESVRVNVDDRGVITGLTEHVDRDDVPDRLAVEASGYRRTRGEQLAFLVDDYLREAHARTPRDPDAFMAAYTPDVQDAEHVLVVRLRELVDRKTRPDDERVLRRTCAILRRAFPDPEAAGLIADILRCADGVLTAPWDPDETV